MMQELLGNYRRRCNMAGEPLSPTPLEQVERAKRLSAQYGVNSSLIHTSDVARWQIDSITATGADLTSAVQALDKVGHKHK
jgi:hypothetical protein